MVPCVVLFGALFILEVLFWLTPFQHVMDKLSLKGTAFYLLPVHYWIRILVAIAVIFGFNVPLVAAFGGGFRGWVASFALGIVVCSVSVAMFCISPHRLSGALRVARSLRFWAHSAHILVYPSLVEELLFRWLLVGMLQPREGWWVLVAAPTVNIVWHLPVWISSFRTNGIVRWKQLMMVAIQAWIFGAILTAIYALTQNLIGVILAHFFGDWVNVAMQYGTQRRNDVAPTVQA